MTAAFAELQRALAEQRDACQSFKAEVKRLDTAIGHLHDNLSSYRSNLSKIDTQPLRGGFQRANQCTTPDMDEAPVQIRRQQFERLQ